MLKEALRPGELVFGEPNNSTLLLGPHEIKNAKLARFLNSQGIKTKSEGEITAERVFRTAQIHTRFAFQKLGAEPEDIAETVPRFSICTATETLRKMQWEPHSLDRIISTTSYPFRQQKVSSQIAEAVCASNVQTTDVLAACSGGAVSIVEAFKGAKTGRVLIVGTEHYTAKMADDLNRTLFSDGSVALAFELGDFELIFQAFEHKSNSAILLPIDETAYHKDALKIPIPNKTPNGQRVEYFAMDGPAVLQWVIEGTPMEKTVEAYREAQKHSRRIHVVTHQGSGRMANDFQKFFTKHIPEAEPLKGNVSLTGNLGSASVLAELHHLFSTTHIRKGDAIVFISFGAGLIVAGGVLLAKRDIPA